MRRTPMRMTLSALLKQRRADLGEDPVTPLSQEKAAEMTGVKQSTFSRWEKAKSVPDDENVPKVAEFLQLAQGEVLTLIHEFRLGTGETRLAAKSQTGSIDEKIAQLPPKERARILADIEDALVQANVTDDR